MINSAKMRKNLITPERAASFIPFFISAGISIVIISFFVIPKYIKSNKVNLELKSFIRKKNDLDNLKSQYKIINKKFEKLNQEKTKIIELVTGRSNLDTLLDKIGEIASRNNIEYVSIVPLKLMKYEENAEKNDNLKINNNEKKITDPLLVEGSKKYLIDLTFKAEFVNILAFLRELEFQESAILINDINLKLLSQNNNTEIVNTSKKLEVKLSATFYGIP